MPTCTRVSQPVQRTRSERSARMPCRLMHSQLDALLAYGLWCAVRRCRALRGSAVPLARGTCR
eukprot:692247-Prymnesium_polylepis.1